MSDSPQTHVTIDEVVPLTTIAGSGDTQNDNTGQGGASCCDDKNHRKLAICSIICGVSCIGIKALINSVKAEKSSDLKTAAKYSQRARKLGIISIVTWVAILTLIPMLMALVSYLFTLID